MDRDHSGLLSLFVDNLPEDVGILWFRKFSSQYGVVKDAYIPFKRSKVTNRRFGFVRYDCATSAEVAISKANGFWIDDRRLFVKRAAFQANRIVPNHKKLFQNSAYLSTDGKSSKGVDSERSCKSNEDGLFLQQGKPTVSFADVVKGMNVAPSIFSIKGKENDWGDGEDWLSRSVIAKLPSFRSIESIRENFYMEGVLDVLIRSLGGNYVVLTFPTVGDMEAMIEGPEVNWLGNFFDEFRPWSPESNIELSRTVWLNCYGIPLHVWNANTFFSIGRIWGEPITLDDDTSKGLSFSSGKVQISTKSLHVINQEIKLEVKGRLYPIWVVEEQIVVNNSVREFCGCKCKGSDSHRSDKLEEDRSTDSKGDNLEKDNVAVNKDHIVEMVAARENVENVESNQLSLSIVGDGRNLINEEVEEPNVFVHEFAVTTRGDEDDLSHVYENGHLLNLGIDEKSFDAYSDSSSIAKMTTVDFHSEDCNLVSADPLIKYVDFMRQKKKRQSKNGNRRNPIWSKNPLKAAMFSRRINRKKGSVDDSIDGLSLSTQEEVCCDILRRNSILIKEARENMKMCARLGVKYHGRESFNIKKILELKGVEISEQEIKAELKALDKLEGDASISLEF